MRIIKRFKTIISLFTAAVMLSAAGVCQGALAAETPAFSASGASGEPGDEVTVDINISNNPGVVTFRLNVSYDTSALTLTGAKAKSFSSATFGPLQSPLSILWNESASPNNTANGTVASLTFKINKGTAPGKYSVNVSCEEAYNFDLDDVAFSTSGGSVNVKEPTVDVEGVALDKNSMSLKIGESGVLNASVTPANATDRSVIWKSSNTKIATVDKNGKVTAVAAGTANITATSSDGGFSDLCKVTVSCPHKNTKTYPENKPTCEAEGNGEYTICNDCGEVIKGSSEKLPLADHSYGKLITEVPATYYKEGAKAHYKCSVCGKLFDKNKKPVKSAALVIPKLTQDYKVMHDDTHHWLESQIGTVKDKEKHNLKWVTDTPATEDEAGVMHQECKECGYITSQDTEIPKLEHLHEMKLTEAKQPTCCEEGNIEYYTCSVCGKLFSDADGLNPLEDTVIPADESLHFGGEANCSQKAVCEICGKEYGELDPDKHQGETEIKNAKEATETEEGYTGDTVCKGCGEILIKGEVIPAAIPTDESAAEPAEPEVSSAPDDTDKPPIALFIGGGIFILAALAAGGIVIFKKIRK